MKRACLTLEEANYVMKNGSRKIVSILPIDHYDCDCFAHRKEWMEKFSLLSLADRKKLQEGGDVFTCPRSKQKGMEKYAIYCGNCGDLLAYLYALDSNLTNWCNLHYISQSQADQEIRETKEPTFYKNGKVKKDKKGMPKLVTVRTKVKVGYWHGAFAVNVEEKYPKIECACGAKNLFDKIIADGYYKYKIKKVNG